MIHWFSAQNKMKRLYRPTMSNIYEYRFLNDLSSGYSFYLRDEKSKQNFLTIEPKGCKLSKLVEDNCEYDFSDDFEKIIDDIAYDLVAFGRAYIYLHPVKKQSVSMELESIEIQRLKGFVQKKNKTKTRFYVKRGDETVEKIIMPMNQLIELDIKDIGYNRHYFRNIIKKLDKCDATDTLLKMQMNSVEYDYLVHKEKLKMRELKVLKDIGWFMSDDGLSDSYILYKRIELNQLRIRFLTYILDKLNDGLKSLIDINDGEIVAHIKALNYDQLWSEYSRGEITGTDLDSILSACY